MARDAERNQYSICYTPNILYNNSFHVCFAGWFLIWKAFLSKFRLVRELLGQEEPEEVHLQFAGEQNQNVRARKARRD